MPHHVRMKFAALVLLASALSCLGVARASAQDTRFSQSINADERTACGLARLNSDQTAILDALVRRDTGRIATSSSTDAPAAERFSQRLTADERRNAGLLLLNDTEVAKLDAFIDRYQNGKLARTLLAAPRIASPSRRVTTEEAKPERRIHGTFSLSYGWGSGGYSEKSGSMVLNYDDPAGRYSVTIGYSETHIKGPHVYRDPYLYRDPLTRPLEP